MRPATRGLRREVLCDPGRVRPCCCGSLHVRQLKTAGMSWRRRDGSATPTGQGRTRVRWSRLTSNDRPLRSRAMRGRFRSCSGQLTSVAMIDMAYGYSRIADHFLVLSSIYSVDILWSSPFVPNAETRHGRILFSCQDASSDAAERPIFWMYRVLKRGHPLASTFWVDRRICL